jgi:hypothetical protein
MSVNGLRDGLFIGYRIHAKQEKSAVVYSPPLVRATGIGWAAGIGRAAAVLSRAIAGQMIRMEVAPFAVPGMLAVLLKLSAVGVLRFWSAFQRSSAN